MANVVGIRQRSMKPGTVIVEKGKTMFCEDFDKFSYVYTVMGGRRGNGAICFLTSRNAKLRAQLETARAKIKDLEQQLLNKDIRIARLTKGEKPEVIYMAAPAVPGPEIADPNIMELCFHNGERHMKEKICMELTKIAEKMPCITVAQAIALLEWL